MTRLACAALFFFSLFPAPLLWGLNRTSSAVHKVNACLRPNTPVDFGVLLHSKVIAVGLFHRVGVDVSWTCSADPESPPANTESSSWS